MGIPKKGVMFVDLNMLLAIFTILSGIVAVIDLVKYVTMFVRWIIKMICTEKK